MRSEKSVLDVHDLAEIFNCSAEKIKRMARRGELPAFKFGKVWYVRPNDLEQFLANAVRVEPTLRIRILGGWCWRWPRRSRGI
ncbi:MAG TPA: helix-turn-helix domain-containing protein [Terriglobales bacterium]|nr:helix-turn-helix domain-containing protein [Terriglobales bacterium]